MFIFVSVLGTTTRYEVDRVDTLKCAIARRTGIPECELRLLCNGKDLQPTTALCDLSEDSTVFLLCSLRLLGGKGGFGSLLRGQKAHKKTTDFSSSRDLNGRRLRHVRQDKMLEEWYAKAGERAARAEQEKQAQVRENWLVAFRVDECDVTERCFICRTPGSLQ
jgi:hypothetical protein